MEAFSIFWYKIHYYWIFYAVSFILWFSYIRKIIGDWIYFKVNRKKEFLEDIFLYVGLWVLVWWRLGYVFFYNFAYFLENPLKVFFINEWWMAFAWAFIWVWIWFYLLWRKYKISTFSISDLVLSFAPFGIMIWRLWNYLNWELFGDKCPNFLINTILCKDYWNGYLQLSNQLLESFFEGFVLFVLLQFFVRKKSKLQNRGFVTVFFILYYSICRFILEFLRYHPQDYILHFWLSISQYFMILFFILWLFIFYKKRSLIFKKSL